ncbi:hypothetical protein [Aureimonas psammosilenae]|uniref:hypothetical protein n=1 Tax=Aureimonas psammosilenae TaxID=2495496 RepID=UPI001F2BED88|nr:hypothetical protein [Aureimonas psammosilenae]
MKIVAIDVSAEPGSATAEVPIGGTTGCDHGDNPNVLEAARYLASLPRLRHPRPIIPHLKEKFGLTAKEACEALAQCSLILARAH